MSYFDHNATSPLSPAAREAWMRAQDELWQNPSSPTRAAARVPYVCDATQWLGKLPASGLGKSADWLIASAHKFSGPKGVGFSGTPPCS